MHILTTPAQAHSHSHLYISPAHSAAAADVSLSPHGFASSALVDLCISLCIDQQQYFIHLIARTARMFRHLSLSLSLSLFSLPPHSSPLSLSLSPVFFCFRSPSFSGFLVSNFFDPFDFKFLQYPFINQFFNSHCENLSIHSTN